jgi:hypothetical protein
MKFSFQFPIFNFSFQFQIFNFSFQFQIFNFSFQFAIFYFSFQLPIFNFSFQFSYAICIAKCLSLHLAIMRRHFLSCPHAISNVIAISNLCSYESKTVIISWSITIFRSRFAFLSFVIEHLICYQKIYDNLLISHVDEYSPIEQTLMLVLANPETELYHG